jgi:hypothetical protein
MPKNPYQRPQKPVTNHAVPRHGAPLPAHKAEVKKIQQSKQDAPSLPPLEALLARADKQH